VAVLEQKGPSMQGTFVKLEERHREALQERARAEGCTMSDLIRRATIQFFDLPTDGPIGAVVEQHVTNGNAVTIGEHPNNGGAS